MASLIKVDVYNDSQLPLINRVKKVMSILGREGVFAGKESRFVSSKLAFLITVDGQDAGFIYFVNEDNKSSKILFLDLAVLKEYRGKEVAYTYMKEILDNKELIKNRFVIAEVEETNKSSLRLLEKFGSVKVGNKHYLLQPERLIEFNCFIEDSKVDIEEPLYDYREMYDEIMNSEDDGYQKKLIM